MSWTSGGLPVTRRRGRGRRRFGRRGGVDINGGRRRRRGWRGRPLGDGGWARVSGAGPVKARAVLRESDGRVSIIIWLGDRSPPHRGVNPVRFWVWMLVGWRQYGQLSRLKPIDAGVGGIGDRLP